jgi:hypothetical protein
VIVEKRQMGDAHEPQTVIVDAERGVAVEVDSPHVRFDPLRRKRGAKAQPPILR